MRTPETPAAAKTVAEKPAASAAAKTGAAPKVETSAAAKPALEVPGAGDKPLGAPGALVAPPTDDETDARVNAAIGDAIAGRRPLPTPAAEGSAAIAEAVVDPRPGSGTFDTFETRFEGLTEAEVAAFNRHLALAPAAQLAAFRAFLTGAPIDPTKGHGSLDERLPGSVAGAIGRVSGDLAFAAPESRARRPMPTLPPGNILGGGVAEFEERDPNRNYIRVKSARDGHRRAGRAWSIAAVVVPVDDFSEAQLDQLLADPTLTVTAA